MDVDSPSKEIPGVSQGPGVASETVPKRFQRLQEMWEDDEGLAEAFDAVLAEAAGEAALCHSGREEAVDLNQSAQASDVLLPEVEASEDVAYGKPFSELGSMFWRQELHYVRKLPLRSWHAYL